MKKALVLITLIGFICSLMAFATPATAKSLTLRWAHPSPKRGSEVGYMEWVTSELEKRTEGRVKATVYWSGSLVKIKEGAEAVKNGLADIAWVSSSYHPGYGDLGKVPYTAGFLAAHPDPVVLTKAWMETNDEIPGLVDQFKAKNMRPFVYKWYDIYWGFSNTAVRSPAEYNGVKVRTVGEQQQVGLKAVGGVPVFLPFPEVYSSLSKNIIQAVWASPDTAGRYKIQDVVKYVIQHDIMGSWAYWCINLDTYNKLAPKDQEILLQLGRELSIKIAAGALEERNRLVGVFKEKGLELIRFSKENVKAWAKNPEIKQYYDKLLDELEGQGWPAKKMSALYVNKVKPAGQ